MKQSNPGDLSAAEQQRRERKKKRTLRRRAKRDATINQKLDKILTVSRNLSQRAKILQARIEELEKENAELKGPKNEQA